MQSVTSLPRMRIHLKNVSYNVDSTLGNMSVTISDAKMNITTFIFRSIDGLDVAMHLDVKLLNNPSNKYERFFDKSANLCDAMLNPVLDPMITMVLNTFKNDKRNKIFTKCPVPEVGLLNIFVAYIS